jgi:hypothetical protein
MSCLKKSKGALTDSLQLRAQCYRSVRTFRIRELRAQCYRSARIFRIRRLRARCYRNNGRAWATSDWISIEQVTVKTGGAK